MSIVWDETNTVRLIKEYERQSVLWDPKNRAYHHRNARVDGWTAIAEAMNSDIIEIKRKMNSLIAVFRSQQRKGVVNPRWWARHMGFLLTTEANYPDEATGSFIKAEKIVHSPAESDNSLGVASDDLDNSDCEFIALDSRKRSYQPAYQELRAQFESAVPVKRLTVAAVELEPHSVAKTSAKEPESPPQPSRKPEDDKTPEPGDDISLYVQYMGAKLAKYSQRTRSQVLYHFNRILFEADMGLLEGETEAASIQNNHHPAKVKILTIPASTSIYKSS